jgi:hypothetical protein
MIFNIGVGIQLLNATDNCRLVNNDLAQATTKINNLAGGANIRGRNNIGAADFPVVTVAEGGTGAGMLTGLLQGNGTSAFTAIANSSMVGQVLRVTGTLTYGWGALDLADSDAVTGDLPFANLTQGQARSVLGITGNATADVASIQSSAGGQALNSTSTSVAWTATPTLGVAGATRGTLTMAGNTSGSQVWRPAAAASGTITWPAGTVDFSGTGGASQVVKQTSVGGIFTVGQLSALDLSNGTTGSGSAVLASSPTITTPTLSGLATAGSLKTTSLLSTLWNVDVTGQGTVSLANNGTTDTAAGGGLIFVAEDTGAASGVVFASFGNTTVIASQPAGSVTNTQGTASKINVYYNGAGAYRVENTLGSTKNIFISGIRVRTSG